MKRVLLFLSEGFEEAEASGFIDVCGWSRVVQDVEPVELVTVGLRPEIRAAHSLVVKSQRLLQDVDPATFDAIAVPGGFHARGFAEDAYQPQVLEAIRTIHGKGGVVAAVCVGALPLARAGVLRGRQATTYPVYPAATSRDNRAVLGEMGAKVVDVPIVVDERIITSTGPATAFDVALTMLEMLVGKTDADKVRQAMQFQA